MKKVLVLLTLLTVTLLGDKIGFVDVQTIMGTHPKAKTIAEELNAEKSRLEKDINEKGAVYLANKQALEEKGDSATEEEKTALLQQEKELQAYIAKLQKQLTQMEQEKTSSLQTEVYTAIKEVAKENEVDIVINKTSVILGGVDLTKKVTEFLSGTEKISLD
jgi:Skp family chaperone for outer membrane proteins